MAEIGEVVASRSPLVLVCQQQLPDLCCMLSCGCISHNRVIYSLSRECKPTTTQPNQDPGAVVVFEDSSKQSRCSVRAGLVICLGHKLSEGLGVLVDSNLTMFDHITAICQAAYYQLR